jgi:beta-glucosidase
VLVLTNGSALALPWESEHIGGILEAWYPGEEGGRAVADVLFGDYNPAGKLPVTFYRSVDDLPPFESYGMEGRTYRYFRGKPVYPFGYGLSYTHTSSTKGRPFQSHVSGQRTRSRRVTLANRGERAGDEVVQIYVTGPDTAAGAPIRSLKAFTRIHLKKGEAEIRVSHAPRPGPPCV